MRQTIQAKFENLDTAEAAASAVRKHLQATEILAVYPEHPESIRLTHPHPRRFTLLPTAVLSQNYITALVETEYNFEDLSEIQKRQTSVIQLLCEEQFVPEAHKIITARGGTILPPS
ncbi:MAG: hypothetical protein IJ512_04265 [Ruminococcus sp.]|nr:hypothetical protein [Ruminococcus sp.]